MSRFAVLVVVATVRMMYREARASPTTAVMTFLISFGLLVLLGGCGTLLVTPPPTGTGCGDFVIVCGPPDP